MRVCTRANDGAGPAKPPITKNVNANLRLVISIAKPCHQRYWFSGSCTGRHIGLMRAVDKIRLPSGVQGFQPYATVWKFANRSSRNVQIRTNIIAVHVVEANIRRRRPETIGRKSSVVAAYRRIAEACWICQSTKLFACWKVPRTKQVAGATLSAMRKHRFGYFIHRRPLCVGPRAVGNDSDMRGLLTAACATLKPL